MFVLFLVAVLFCFFMSFLFFLEKLYFHHIPLPKLRIHNILSTFNCVCFDSPPARVLKPEGYGNDRQWRPTIGMNSNRQSYVAIAPPGHRMLK